MTRRIMAVAMALTLVFAVGASAHSPENAIFAAWQWWPGLEPTMDGVGAEYEVIPESYWQVTDQFPDTQGGRDIDPSNFDAKATITYSLATNEIYAFSEVYDDISIPPDTWQFLIDADHSGGDCYPSGTDDDARWQAAGCQQYEVYNNMGPTENGPGPVHFFWGAATWLPEVNWYNIWSTFDGNVDGPGTVFREVRFVPLSDLNGPAGADDSTIHTMAEDEIIGIGYNWMDYDTPGRVEQGGGGPWQAFYNLTQHDQMYRSGDGSCDFYLSPIDTDVPIPSAIDATTWGRIKVGFVE